jgi:hypothetical protein
MTAPRTDEQRERLKGRALAALAGRVGKARAIGMAELHEAVFEVPVKHRINDTRGTRGLVAELRRDGFMVISDQDGYWTAADAEEFRTFKQRMRRRALHSLKQVADMERQSLGELLGQLALDFKGGG